MMGDYDNGDENGILIGAFFMVILFILSAVLIVVKA